MKNYIKSALVAISAVIMLGSCTEKFDTPDPYTVMTDQDIKDDGYTLITIAELKQIFDDAYPDWYDGTNFKDAVKINLTRLYAIKGKVISTDWYGNVYRSLYLQDHTGAIEVKVGNTGMFGHYPPGTWVYVKTDNLVLGNYRYNLSLGSISNREKYANGYIEFKNDVNYHILRGGPAQMTAADTLEITSANIGTVMNDATRYTVKDWDGNTIKATGTNQDLQLNFNQRYTGALIKFKDIESVWGTIAEDGSYASDGEYPQFIANPNLSDFSEPSDYDNFTFSFREAIDQWTNYNPEQPSTTPTAPRPGTQGIQDPDKDFITYPTWAFRNNSSSYYGSSVWRLGTGGSRVYFTIRASGYSNFALEKLPDNGATVDMTAILTRYGSSSGGFRKYQLVLNSSKDVIE